MILEYLFFGKEEKEAIKKLINEDIDIKFENIKKSNYLIVNIVVKKDEVEDEASILSDIDKEFTDRYGDKKVTLINEAASYYNKELYPLVNEFERKLRKVIYMAIELLSNNQEEKELINNLERKNLGEIFDSLFIDENFNNELKIKVNRNNKNNKRYSKDQILNKIKEIKEETLWNKYLGNESSPILQKEFKKVQEYRNSIMHAHNIGEKKYQKIKLLYLDINEELDDIIKNIKSRKVIKPEEHTLDFSEALMKQLKSIESAGVVANNPVLEMMKQMQGIQMPFDMVSSKGISINK